MLTQTLPVPVPVSRSPARRLADALGAAWSGWRRRRAQERALEHLIGLDDHTLRDIGAPAELRAYAEARHSGAYQRLNDLLR